MDDKVYNKLLTLIGLALVIGVIVSFFKFLNKKTETKIMSEDGMSALKNPEKRQKIEDAINNSKKHHKKTGVWKDPVIDI